MRKAKAVALRRCGRGVATADAVQAALTSRPQLSDEQRAMVQRLTRDGDGVAVIVGPAGTGKTTAIAAAREAWQAPGVPVQGCATARKAAHHLGRTAGMQATSVAALLLQSRPLEPGTVLVIDEASMLGTRACAELLERIDAARGKLVIAGDTSQLAAIEAGGMFGPSPAGSRRSSCMTTAARNRPGSARPSGCCATAQARPHSPSTNAITDSTSTATPTTCSAAS